MSAIKDIIKEIKSHAPIILPRIVKIGFQLQPGGYGYGDKVCGTRWPILREIAKCNKNIELDDCEKLLQNPLHEARFVALVILNLNFKKFPQKVVDIYMRNLKFINNWDLADVSARYIIGEYCALKGDNTLIMELSDSDNFWENRISVVATFAYIKREQFMLTLDLCEKFLDHEHHLVHKACGWAMREISKRDPQLIIEFIGDHQEMPSVMKSYAMEWIRKKLKNKN